MANRFIIEIEREKKAINVKLWQPLMLLGFVILMLLGFVSKNYFLYSSMLLTFSMFFVFYIYLNFIRKPSKLLCNITPKEFHIVELDNPFSLDINCQIKHLETVEIFEDKKAWYLTPTKFLKCSCQNKSYLIQLNSFWFGDISNASLQEFFFYLDKYNPKVKIDESLNVL
ncbi:MAG: hypothetical protein ACPGXZ_16995, partial [Saprospiraceae bacterium]